MAGSASFSMGASPYSGQPLTLSQDALYNGLTSGAFGPGSTTGGLSLAGNGSYPSTALSVQPSAPTQQINAYGGTGTSGYGSASANFINQAYDTRRAGYQGLLDTLNPQQDAAILNVNNQYQNQSNALATQKAQGTRNLGIATEQVQTGKVRSLGDLTRQVSTMGRSYANQLGAYGAADSSAAGLINQALSGLASRNRSDVLYNASNQQRGIDLQGQDLETDFANNQKMLDDWKSSTVNDIATKFLSQRQAIQQQMQTADADRYQALAQLDANYTQQAIKELANLENQYKTNAQNLIQQYQTIQGPNVAINPQLQQYAVQPINAGKIAQLSVAPNVSTGNQPTSYATRRPFQEDYGFGL